jgi:hypothetical protein
MKQMKYRTTYALDELTVTSIKRLATLWSVSQAEVVRRAVAMADEKSNAESDRSAGLLALRESGELLVREQAEEYLVQVRDQRQQWRGDS